MRIKEVIPKNKLFWTSDPHFYHKNIIEYCNRPFEDVEEMHKALITNWNNVVPEDGYVFILGDLAMTGNIGRISQIIHSLNGIKYLIMGNHDYQNKLDKKGIHEVFEGRIMDVAELKVDDEEVEGGHVNFFMSHYPHLYWRRGFIHLHGHVHSGPTATAKEKVLEHPMRYDVGVDNNNYTPVSYHQLKVILTKKII